MRGFFERRGREGFAKDAEEQPKEYRKRKSLGSLITLFLIARYDHMTLTLVYFLMNSLLLVFFGILSASSAKPSRPLRSKNPRI
jgi:hypothetical protein